MLLKKTIVNCLKYLKRTQIPKRKQINSEETSINRIIKIPLLKGSTRDKQLDDFYHKNNTYATYAFRLLSA